MMSNKTTVESEYKICNGNRDYFEIFHVKLTDSALKSLENFSRRQTKPIQLNVEGNSGTLCIHGKQSFDSFDLAISPLHHNTDGALDFIRLQGKRVISFGKPISRFTVQANDESFNTARLRMAEAEKDQRKCQSKGPLLQNAKRPDFRESNMNPRSVPTPPGSRGPESRISPSSNNISSRSPLPPSSYRSPTTPNAEVGSRQLRDRIIHLLAVRAYQRPELLLRLKRDGLTDEQKEQVEAILSKVGRTGRHGEYLLAQPFTNLVEPTWPGYSSSERSIVTSLKAKLQSTSPNGPRVTPNSRQNSPLSAVVVAAVAAGADDFSRKPTRASAPSAPHSLNKKIAALDLLSTGIAEATVAAQHGITTNLLEQWKTNEASLRNRYCQRQGSTMPQSTVPPHSSSQDILNGTGMNPNTSNISPVAKSSRVSILPPPPASASGTMSVAAVTGDGQPTATNKRSRPNSSSYGGTSLGSSSPSSQSSQNRQKRPESPPTAAPTTEADADLDNLHPPLPIKRKRKSNTQFEEGRPLTAAVQSSAQLLPPPQAPLPARISVSHHSKSRPHHQRRPRDLGSETSSCGESGSSSGGSLETTPPTHRFDQPGDKQRLGAFPPDKTSSDFSEDDQYLNDCVSAKSAELNRLFPPISSQEQAESYRHEFDALYPPYLSLYESFRKAWNTVSTLKKRIIATMDLDHVTAQQIAVELDEFLKVMRTPERREQEIRLLEMTCKLRLLKERIAVFYNSGGAGGGSSNGDRVESAMEAETGRKKLLDGEKRNGLVRAGAYQ